jgi:hypothetical protein
MACLNCLMMIRLLFLLNLLIKHQTIKQVENKVSLFPDKPAYPILISLDQEGFDESLKTFLRLVSTSISRVKELYNELKFEEPFNDQIWKSICHRGTVFIKELYAKKIQSLADNIGVSDGLVSESILNKKHPNIAAINTAIESLTVGLGPYYNRTKGQLRPDQIINVNTTPTLSEDAYEEHLLAYSHYINNENEASIKRTLDRLASSYNNFVNELHRLGYGQHIESINGSYLKNFFTQSHDYHLKTDLSAPRFLANFKKA